MDWSIIVIAGFAPSQLFDTPFSMRNSVILDSLCLGFKELIIYSEV